MKTVFYKKEMLTNMLSETNIYKSQHHKSSFDRNIYHGIQYYGNFHCLTLVKKLRNSTLL